MRSSHGHSCGEGALQILKNRTQGILLVSSGQGKRTLAMRGQSSDEQPSMHLTRQSFLMSNLVNQGAAMAAMDVSAVIRKLAGGCGGGCSDAVSDEVGC
jgi:hypothetical protein